MIRGVDAQRLDVSQEADPLVQPHLLQADLVDARQQDVGE